MADILKSTLEILNFLEKHGAAISALTALLAVIIGPLVTLYIARKQIYASTVSSNRIRWVEDLRMNIADFMQSFAELYVILEDINAERTRPTPNKEKLRQLRQERRKAVSTVSKSRYLIMLKINFSEKNHSELARKIEESFQITRDLMSRNSVIGLKSYGEEIRVIARKVLKDEWNRAKKLR